MTSHFHGFERALGHTLSMATSPSIWQNGLPVGNGQYGGTFYQPEETLFEYAFTRLNLWKRRLVGPERMPLDRFLALLKEQGVDALMKELDKEFFDQERPNFKPGGCLRLSLPSAETLFSKSMSLHLAYGEIHGETEVSCRSTQWTALVSPEQDVTAVHIKDGYLHPQCTFKFQQRLELFRKYDAEARILSKGVTQDGILYVVFDFGEELKAISAVMVDKMPVHEVPSILTTGVALEITLDYTEDELAVLKSSLDHQDAVCSKRYAFNLYHTLIVDELGTGGDLVEQARRKLMAACQTGFDALQASNRAWWKTFWDKSGIALENASLEGLWYNNLYQLAATSRGQAMPGLFGLWNGSATAPWNGDYHGNINVAMYTWPLFGLNHPELLEPLFATLGKWFPAMRRQTRRCFGVDELRFPQACGPYGEEMSRGFYRTMRCSTGFYIDSYWKKFLYSPDKDELKNTLLPIMESAARYYFIYCQQDADGCFHIGPSWAPEQGAFPAWDTVNDLALFKEVFSVVVEANRFLGEWSPTAAHAQELLNHFPAYPMKDGEFLISGSESGRTLLTMPSYMACVVPAEEIDADVPLAPVALKTLKNHDQHVIRKGLNGRPGLGCDLTAGWLFVCAAKLRSSEMAQLLLKEILISNHVKSNAMFGFMGGEILDTIEQKRQAYDVKETQNHSLLWQTASRTGREATMSMIQIGCAVLYGIMECMMQSQKHQLKLFPTPLECMGSRFSFHELKAEGGLVVSASCGQGRLEWFSIQNATQIAWQGTLRLFDAQPPAELVCLTRSLKASEPGIYNLELMPGELLEYVRNDIMEMKEAVPPHTPAVRSYGPSCPIAYGDSEQRV